MKTSAERIKKNSHNSFNFSLFQNYSTDIFCIVGSDGYLKKTNPALVKLLGYTEKELVTVPYIEFLHPEDRKAIPLGNKLTFKKYTSTSFEGRVRKSSGEYCWVSWSVVLIVEMNLIYVVGKDITDKKISEQKLREAVDRYEMITEATSASIWEWEFGAPTSYWHGNKMKYLLGASDADDGNSYLDWERNVHPEDLPGIMAQMENIFKSKDEYLVNEYRYKNIFGQYMYVRNRARIIRNKNGEAVRLIGVMDDNTSEKLALKSLMEREKEYKSLFESAPLPQLIFDLETAQFLNANAAAVKHYGCSTEEFLQMTIYDLKPEEHAETVKQVLKDIREGRIEKAFNLRAIHVKKSGERMTVELNFVKSYYKGHNASLVTVNDITEKIRLHERITKQKLLEQRKIAKATFAALEKERSFIGKELHDNVNQILSGTKLLLEFAKENDDLREDLIGKSVQYIKDAIREIRSLSKSLTSPIINDLGLDNAIKELFYPYLLSGLFEIHFKKEGAIEDVNYDIQYTVFRIIQEQLNNISKYADPKNVFIEITAAGDRIKATVKDDGKGFNPSIQHDGIGISNIKSRVNALNGKVDIYSQVGNGCTVEVFIPCK